MPKDNSANMEKVEPGKRVAKIFPPSNKKYFDKELKSYIYSLEQQNAKLCLPGADNLELGLNQKYLVLHIHILLGQPWTL